MNMPTRETSTILAALRCYQQHLEESDEEMPSEFRDIATDGGTLVALTSDEIDALCEHLNLGDISPRNETLENFARAVLELLEKTPEWDGDTLDQIAYEAMDRALADNKGTEGMFRVLKPAAATKA